MYPAVDLHAVFGLAVFAALPAHSQQQTRLATKAFLRLKGGSRV